MKKIFLTFFLCFITLISFTQTTNQDSTIKMVYLRKPNSVGGVDVAINWNNYSHKPVKYITFTLTPYNAVDDVVYCSITKKSTLSVKATGPYAKGFHCSPNAGGSWSNVWYNQNITYCILSKVTIQYMDGKQKVISKIKIKSTNDVIKFTDMMFENGLKFE